MEARELEAIVGRLEAMIECVSRAVAAVGPARATERTAGGGFSLVENVWHLADLEREGYAARLTRLRHEPEPALPDFDGDRLAVERDYQSLSLERGLAAFIRARRDNLAALRSIVGDEWDRAGTQDGVGRVRLEDVPRMMLRHDAGHRAEIQALLAGAPAFRGESACA
jgi:hypothetical protein